MNIDKYVHWLSRLTLAVAVIMIGWGLGVLLGEPVTVWFAASTTTWMALLLISALWQLRGSFTAIAALILWYRLPVDPFDKAILLSYVPFLLVFTVSMRAWAEFSAGSAAGGQRPWFVTYAYQLAYLALMVHWARAAWRRVEEPARPPALRRGVREAASA